MPHCVRIKVMQLDGNILERIGIAIRLLRKGKGLTQLELSERCGVDRKVHLQYRAREPKLFHPDPLPDYTCTGYKLGKFL